MSLSAYLWRLVGVVLIPFALGGCTAHTAQSSTVRKQSAYDRPKHSEKHEPKAAYTESGKKPRLVCSFCGKSHTEVKKLIAGPQVYICNECVALCNDILAEDETRVTPQVGDEAGTE